MKSTARDTAAYVRGLMELDKSTIAPDGGERFNRLIFAKSPYLLQHAENPVNWYEWGDAAFDKAREENLPVLLSIGYATCHWCHVMAHESFEDDDVAQLLNRHFIAIKVDREERPDIDAFYMTVSQLLTGSGGWPLNVFITPDRRPFMAITYLPKRARAGISGLMELLANIATLWRQRPDMIEKNCRGIMEELAVQRTNRPQQDTPALEMISKNAFTQLARLYDAEHGGFGGAPKFPMPIYLRWLITQGAAGHKQALEMALTTVRRMRAGGIWDQLAGGLHRYSVDRIWLAPHFEKMLYDQAMLAQVALDAFQVTGDRFFSVLSAEIFAFVEQELLSPEGAFCAALDADSEGVEGKYYLWNREEVEACLGDDAKLFCDYFDVRPEGNFEGDTILNISENLQKFCEQSNCDLEETRAVLETCRLKLLERRAARIRPLTDAKMITAWNGLMIAALARGGIICDSPHYLQVAEKAASFILSHLRRADGRLLRSYLGGPSVITAFLEDYAFLALGSLELYEGTLDSLWLSEALFLGDEILRLFRDPETGEFFQTAHDAEQMPSRVTADHDGVTPSALSATGQLLLRLGWVSDRSDLIAAAHDLLDACRGELARNPLSQLGIMQLASLIAADPFFVRLSGDNSDDRLLSFLQILKHHFIPNLVIHFTAASGEIRASVCAHKTCFDVTTATQLKETLLLAGVAPPSKSVSR